MRALAPFLAGILLFAGPTSADQDSEKSGTVVHVDAAKAAKLLAQEDKTKRPVVVDIRTNDEFAEGHLAGATLIDFLADEFSAKLSQLERDRPYLVHCRSGGRSKSSLETWRKLGFKQVYHLDGGIQAWKKEGLPVVK